MVNRNLLGRFLCLMGLLLLTVFVPIIPDVAGIPLLDRIRETLIFWVGLGMAVFGRRVPAISQTGEADAARLRIDATAAILASLGVVLATFVCVVALTNLLYSTLWGAGILRLPQMMTLYRGEYGYFAVVPLLLAVLWQLPLLWRSKTAADALGRPGCNALRLACLVAFVAFLLCVPMALAARRLIVLAVTMTWFGGLLFFTAACEQLACGAEKGSGLFVSRWVEKSKARTVSGRPRTRINES